MTRLLRVDDLTVRYGRVPAIRRVSVEVTSGEIVGLIGPNGAGKTTLLNSIAGVIRPESGEIEFDGTSLIGVSPEKAVRRGVALVPEGRQVFGTLTVGENLLLPLKSLPGGQTEDRLEPVLERFGVLRKYFDQRASALSGGEQQQLAIARALLTQPRLLMLDEPSLGLAPLLIAAVFDLLEELRAAGHTVLLVEQNAHSTIALADRTYVLRNGEIVLSGTRQELTDRREIVDLYLGARVQRGDPVARTESPP